METNGDSVEQPLVSIIVPAYNAGKTIGYAIESVRSQSYRRWQLLVIDDHSTDHTQEVVRNYIQQDSRIELIKNEFKGVSSARNTGITASQGAFITFLDADDMYYSNALMHRVNYLSAHDSCDAVYCPAEITDENFNSLNWLLGQRPVVSFLDMHACPFHSNSVMLKAAVLKKFRFDEKVANGEDWLLWQRIARTGVKFYLVDTCRVAYRQHRDSTVIRDFCRHENKLVQIISIIYGVDPDCSNPLPEYRNGLTQPDQAVVLAKRRFGLLIYYLLRDDLSNAQMLVKEFSPEVWNQVALRNITSLIKFSIMRYYICSEKEALNYWRLKSSLIKPFLEENFPPQQYPSMGDKLFRAIENPSTAKWLVFPKRVIRKLKSWLRI